MLCHYAKPLPDNLMWDENFADQFWAYHLNWLDEMAARFPKTWMY